MNQRPGGWVFRRAWKEWSGSEMTEKRKSSLCMWQFSSGLLWATSKWSSTNTIPRIYRKRPDLSNGNHRKTCFLGSVLLGPWCKRFLGRSKVSCSFYSQHAACSYELFSEVWIDAGGERSAERRKILMRLVVGVSSVQHVLSDQPLRETELRNCCTGIKSCSLSLKLEGWGKSLWMLLLKGSYWSKSTKCNQINCTSLHARQLLV